MTFKVGPQDCHCPFTPWPVDDLPDDWVLHLVSHRPSCSLYPMESPRTGP